VTPPHDGPGIELDRFELVIFRRPHARAEIPDEQAEQIQSAHLAHLAAMHDAGHMRVAGPFDEQPDEAMRGMCIYRTGSIERTRELAQSDPAVIAGRLAVDVMYWYCPRGQF